jgi:hypothetical protein
MIICPVLQHGQVLTKVDFEITGTDGNLLPVSLYQLLWQDGNKDVRNIIPTFGLSHSEVGEEQV